MENNVFFVLKRLTFLIVFFILMAAQVNPVFSKPSFDRYAPGPIRENGEYYIFLPLILNLYAPLPPDSPLLNPIENADGDGSYTVSWNSTHHATSYVVEEDDKNSFSSPITVYDGANISLSISGNDIGTYYYRVKAKNDPYESIWSNIQSVDVIVSLPECPQAGSWSGKTSQEYSIFFKVENSPQCQIADDTLTIRISTDGWSSFPVSWAMAFAIELNHFQTDPWLYEDWTWVVGDFISTSSANGTFNYYSKNYLEPWKDIHIVGTWNANPVD